MLGAGVVVRKCPCGREGCGTGLDPGELGGAFLVLEERPHAKGGRHVQSSGSSGLHILFLSPAALFVIGGQNRARLRSEVSLLPPTL